jgi:hypothetical protein
VWKDGSGFWGWVRRWIWSGFDRVLVKRVPRAVFILNLLEFVEGVVFEDVGFGLFSA